MKRIRPEKFRLVSTEDRVTKFIGLKCLEIGIVLLILVGGFYVGETWGRDFIINEAELTPICRFKNIQTEWGCSSSEYWRESHIGYNKICGCDSKDDVYLSYVGTWFIGLLMIFVALIFIIAIVGLIFIVGLIIYKWIKWNWEMAGK